LEWSLALFIFLRIESIYSCINDLDDDEEDEDDDEDDDEKLVVTVVVTVVVTTKLLKDSFC